MAASENGIGNNLGAFSWSNSEGPFLKHTPSLLSGLATLTKVKVRPSVPCSAQEIYCVTDSP